MMVEQCDDEYINLITMMIVSDFEDSPYGEFHDYFNDHSTSYSIIFQYKFLVKLLDHIGKQFNLYDR